MKPRPTLDLAVIGNSNIAALIERDGAHRVDLLATHRRRPGVLRAGRRRCARRRFLLDRFRRGGDHGAGLRAQHGHRAHRGDGGLRRVLRDHRLRAALPPVWPHLSALDAHSPHRAAEGRLSHPRAGAAAHGLRPAHRDTDTRQQPHPLCHGSGCHPPHHRRAGELHRRRVGIRPLAAARLSSFTRTKAFPNPFRASRASSTTRPASIGSTGCAISTCRSNGRKR